MSEIHRENDILSLRGITEHLEHKNISENLHIYETLQSTNIIAKELVISGAAHGTAVIANGQTAGQGRFNRRFHSPGGQGIYASFVMRRDRLRFETPTLITAFAAVCVCEAIDAVSDKRPGIKWVNDILLDNKKICGIIRLTLFR